MPCFGAVLNNLNLAVSGYYYSQYYDKSYKDYYITQDGDGAPGSVRRATGSSRSTSHRCRGEV